VSKSECDAKELKRDLKAALEKQGLVLYEDDGRWNSLSPYYDVIQFAAFPGHANPSHLPSTIEQATAK
jgi:hypothetical protein